MSAPRPGVALALATAALALAAAPAGAVVVPAQPIPEDPQAPELQEFSGSPAEPRPIDVSQPPRHPRMAPNGRSNLHVDAFQTDAHPNSGPLGLAPEVLSTSQIADCASVTFDSKGRIITICVGIEGPRLTMFDPRTLDTLAVMPLPPRQPGTGSIFNDFAGGGYFYLDERDQAIIPTTNRRVYVVAAEETVAGQAFVRRRDYDLNGVLAPDDKIISALPDWSGRIWFASIKGIVGYIDQTSGAIKHLDTGEEIANSFAVDDDGGVYIITKAALYRFEAATSGPQEIWRIVYENSGIAKPGQVHAGSGTTPTVMEDGYIAITDNADPMNVVVYRRAASVAGSRFVCKAPVFEKGSSATDQSLIVAGKAIITENNYGYTGPTATMDGATTTPGLERVDVETDGSCRKVWRSEEIAPSVVPKLSLANGLVYTYTKPPREDEVDTWYLTALDFRSGRTVWKRLTGTGLGYNNNYAPVTIGPDGTAYVGVLGGLVAVRDTGEPASGGEPPAEEGGDEDGGGAPSGPGDEPVAPGVARASGAGGRLPFTGFDLTPLVASGLALLLIGLALRRATSVPRGGKTAA